MLFLVVYPTDSDPSAEIGGRWSFVVIPLQTPGLASGLTSEDSCEPKPKSIQIKNIHPKKLTWNLEMVVSNRNLLFQGSIFRFHVCFGGYTLYNK